MEPAALLAGLVLQLHPTANRPLHIFWAPTDTNMRQTCRKRPDLETATMHMHALSMEEIFSNDDASHLPFGGPLELRTDQADPRTSQLG